jgi:hypothetical protein
MRLILRAVIIGLLALLLAACSTGGVTSIWTDPGGTPSPYRNLVVFGVANHAKVQRAYEDNFIASFKAIGVNAQPGQTLAPALTAKWSKAIQKALARSGADGIIITHLVAESIKDAEPPTRATSIPDSYKRVAPYYTQVYSDVMRPGYYSDYQRLRLETNLYDAGKATLIWSGRSPPLDPNSEQTTIRQVIADVIAQLRLDGYLPR